MNKSCIKIAVYFCILLFLPDKQNCNWIPHKHWYNEYFIDFLPLLWLPKKKPTWQFTICPYALPLFWAFPTTLMLNKIIIIEPTMWCQWLQTAVNHLRLPVTGARKKEAWTLEKEEKKTKTWEECRNGLGLETLPKYETEKNKKREKRKMRKRNAAYARL